MPLSRGPLNMEEVDLDAFILTYDSLFLLHHIHAALWDNEWGIWEIHSEQVCVCVCALAHARMPTQESIW